MQGKVFEKNMITQIQRTDYADKDFVLMPLNEIAPDLVHPVFKKSVADLLKGLDDNKKVKIFPQHGRVS